MKTTLAILALGFSFNAAAVRYQQPRLDMKLPTQLLVERQTWDNVLDADASTILNDNAGATSAAAVTVSTGFGTLDFPRNITITPGGTTADVAACSIVVSGTDYLNNAITETFAFDANQSTAETGAKAFRTITSVAFPAACEDSPFGATWDVGSGTLLGLKKCMANAGDYLVASSGGVHESTAPTMAANGTVISSNTVDFDTAYDGSADFRLMFVQSYCD